MVLEIKIPSPGESITEVELASWLVEDGEYVERDQPIAEIESDKATLELPAEANGVIKLLVEPGTTVDVGALVCQIDTSAEGKPRHKTAKVEVSSVSNTAEPVVEAKSIVEESKATPLAREIMTKNEIVPSKIEGTGAQGRITKMDVMDYMTAGVSTETLLGWGGTRDSRNEKMSTLRRKIAQRLVGVKNETAMLTTFNEVDMKPVMDLRKKYKNQFLEVHGTSLGFMSFFTKAVTEALHHFPSVNAMIDGNEIIYHDYADIGIAVSSPKGLMVPVIRNAEQMSLNEIESEIKALAGKARNGKITLDEMTGGTFTITNGGVFGSMLSTPIINPPQSAILGMHNIVERPVAIDGQVQIRPIMYVALSYDHRIIDGKESVGFLLKIKQMLEDPSKMIFGGKDPAEVLLGL
jgi:2-oxoglutarate dehydrogenase E2 component (dihydrolipoamide succinyltransferase)